ncbi:MAG: glycosyltransferase family 2 protein [Thermoprotei archaeon]
MHQPYISVVIIAHRRAYLLRAVQSALKQVVREGEFEVVVAKDFNDPTIEGELSGEGARVLTVGDTSPGGKALAAISACRGEVISFLDDDDEFLPGKLEAVYKAFEARPSLDYYHNGLIVASASGKVLGSTSGGPRLIRQAEKKKYAGYLSKVRADFNSSSISIRKGALDAKLIAEAKYMVDTLYFFSALLRGRDLIVDGRPLTLFRLHSDQTDRVLSSAADFRKRRALTFYRYCKAAGALAATAKGTPYWGQARELLAKRRLQLSLFAEDSPEPLPGECIPSLTDSLLALKPKPSLSATARSAALALAPFAPRAARLAYASRSLLKAEEEVTRSPVKRGERSQRLVG